MRKMFIAWVLPGVAETLASPLIPTSAFRSDDFPTLERPRKAISGRAGSRGVRGAVKEPTNAAAEGRRVAGGVTRRSVLLAMTKVSPPATERGPIGPLRPCASATLR